MTVHSNTPRILMHLRTISALNLLAQSLLSLCIGGVIQTTALAQEDDWSHYLCDTRLTDDYISQNLAGTYSAKITPTAVGSIYGSGIYPSGSDAQIQITWDTGRETLLIGFPDPAHMTPLVNVSRQTPNPMKWGDNDRDAQGKPTLSFGDIEILLNCPVEKLTRFSANTSYKGSIHSLRLVWVTEDPVTLYGTWNWSSHDGSISGVNSNIVLTKR